MRMQSENTTGSVIDMGNTRGPPKSGSVNRRRVFNYSSSRSFGSTVLINIFSNPKTIPIPRPPPNIHTKPHHCRSQHSTLSVNLMHKMAVKKWPSSLGNVTPPLTLISAFHCFIFFDISAFHTCRVDTFVLDTTEFMSARPGIDWPHMMYLHFVRKAVVKTVTNTRGKVYEAPGA